MDYGRHKCTIPSSKHCQTSFSFKGFRHFLNYREQPALRSCVSRGSPHTIPVPGKIWLFGLTVGPVWRAIWTPEFHGFGCVSRACTTSQTYPSIQPSFLQVRCHGYPSVIILIIAPCIRNCFLENPTCDCHLNSLFSSYIQKTSIKSN